MALKREIRFFAVESILQATTKDAIYLIKAPTDTTFKIIATDIDGNIINLFQGSSGVTITNITSTDSSILITGSAVKDLKVSNALQTLINSALQSGDPISSLLNDLNFITLADIPTFVPTDYDLADFTNNDTDPFVRISNLATVATSGEYNDLNNLPPIPSGVTNLTTTQTPTSVTINSDNGTDALIPLGDGVNAGVSFNDYTTAEKDKLNDIEPLAEVNNISDTDATDLTDGGNTTLHNHDSRYYTETETDGFLNNKVDKNIPITGATKTKITYDSKGIVTAGSDATTADIADSTNKRYITDAEKTVVGNTSGTNSGDNATNTQYSGLDASKLNVSNPTATGILTTPAISLTSTTNGFTPNALTTTQRDAIASPTAGTMIFNTTEGYPEYYDAFWGWMPLYASVEWKRKWGIEEFIDFASNAFTNGVWLTNGTATANNVMANTPGLQQLVVSTVGSSAVLQGIGALMFGGGKIVAETKIHINTLSTITDRYQFRTGFGDLFNNINCVDGAYILYDEGGVSTGSTASPNWQIVTTNNSNRTFTPTLIPVTTGFHTFRVVVNAAGTSVEYFVDGTSLGTITTNIPALISTRVTNVETLIAKSAGITAVLFQVDYAYFKQKFTTARN